LSFRGVPACRDDEESGHARNDGLRVANCMHHPDTRILCACPSRRRPGGLIRMKGPSAVLTRMPLPIIAVALTASAVQAQSARQPGLLVSLYDIGQGVHQVPQLAPNQVPNVIKVVPTLELRTDRGDFAPFEGNFYTEVTGFVTIETAGRHTFRLISDDGAQLFIDDRLVVGHDGLHGAVPKDGKINLAVGEHKLCVKHFESGGEEHLELQWRPAGAPEGKFTLIPPKLLTHAADAPRETAPGQKRIIPALRRGRPGDGTPVAGMHPEFQESGVAPGPIPAGLTFTKGCVRSVRDGEVVAWVPPDGAVGADFTAYSWDIVGLTGIYTGQCICATSPEIKRVFIDRTDDGVQGCALRFGTAPAVSATGPRVFEMLTVKAMTNGFEIEFTKPLNPRCGWDPESYYIEQWPFETASDEEGESEPGASATGQSESEAQARAHPPQRDGIRYPVKSASVSPDRRKVFLEISNLKSSHVVYIRLLPPCISEDGELPWSTEAWYTLNEIPENRMGKKRTPPPAEPQNFLTADEQTAGWQLLFDGKTTAGWHGYRKDHMPDGWAVKDDCLVRVGPAGDIATDEQFDNFELKLEWRICPAGNSGIFFRVNEKHDWPFFTGPEFQVLDNAEHADGRNPLTSAGSNYGLHAPLRDVTEPIGLFNEARIVVDGPHVEHWLNGVKIVEYELWTDAWKALVAGSKFKAWPDYGLMKKGHIVLQDHGDQVWYRNIKIRPLTQR